MNANAADCCIQRQEFIRMHEYFDQCIRGIKDMLCSMWKNELLSGMAGITSNWRKMTLMCICLISFKELPSTGLTIALLPMCTMFKKINKCT